MHNTSFDEHSLLMVHRLKLLEWRVLPDPGGSTTGLGVYGSYAPSLASFQPLASLLKKSPALVPLLDRSVIVAIAFLAATMGQVGSSRLHLASIVMVGFFQMATEDALSVLRAGVENARRLLDALGLSAAGIKNADDLIHEVSNAPAQMWPVRRGTFVRWGKNKAVLDLYAATTTLEVVLRAVNISGGTLANARAAHFEDFTQRIIDGSKWRPSDALRQLRGRTLRWQGRKISDIDALGVHEGRLLLVSCKGRVHNLGMELGEYAATRNAESLAKEAVAAWIQVVRTLREHPKGDNYDLCAFDRLTGIVCVPFPMFLHDAKLRNREAAVGLRSLTSIQELKNWLAS